MKYLVTLFLLVAGPALAADSATGSEYRHMAPVDKIEITPALGYKSSLSKLKSGGDSKLTGFSQSVKGEYGLADMFSAGGILRYSGLELKTTGSPSTTSSGFEDPVVFFYGALPVGPGSLRFGADVGFALGKAEIKEDGDSNRASGGISMTPFVGYEMTSGPSTFGGRLSYLTYAGDRTEVDKTTTPETESKKSGGDVTTIVGFFEHNMSPMTLGAALIVRSAAASKSKSDSSTTKTTGLTTTGLKIYVPYEIDSMITLLPELKYDQYTAFDKTVVDSGSSFEVQLGVRITL